jgi:hypothetical protein
MTLQLTLLCLIYHLWAFRSEENIYRLTSSIVSFILYIWFLILTTVQLLVVEQWGANSHW